MSKHVQIRVTLCVDVPLRELLDYSIRDYIVDNYTLEDDIEIDTEGVFTLWIIGDVQYALNTWILMMIGITPLLLWRVMSVALIVIST